jgi:hypothetical protein
MTPADKTLKDSVSGPFVKYVFRISSNLKERVDAVFPPRQHGQSEFYREAITNFLRKEKQALADRPHLRGRENAYKKVCGSFTQAMLDAIKAAYPEVSVSVVIQAAVTSELKKPRYKIASLPIGKQPSTDLTCNDQRQDTDDYQSARGAARELAPAFD